MTDAYAPWDAPAVPMPDMATMLRQAYYGRCLFCNRLAVWLHTCPDPEHRARFGLLTSEMVRELAIGNGDGGVS